jgi:hypothetical protein
VQDEEQQQLLWMLPMQLLPMQQLQQTAEQQDRAYEV